VRISIALIALLLAGAAGGLIVAAFNGSDDDAGSKAGAGSCDVTKVAEERLPSIVTILAGSRNSGGVGSGEVIRSDGYILTNDHVIAPAAASGAGIHVLFSDGERVEASVAGRDPRSDLAVVHMAGHTGLETIPLGDSASLRVGQPVVALGAPLGLSSSVTSGIVSALGRTVRLPSPTGVPALLADAVQTDAAINPGSSGGALVDCAGALIGVPTAGAVVPSPTGQPSSGNIGLGFAIPVNIAKRVADELIETGSVTHAYIGIEAQPLASPGQSGQATGLLVTGVDSTGPAAAAGLREGDVIVSIDGQDAVSVDQIAALTLTKQAGETVEFVYERAGTRATATVTLGRAP
jgi:putative serine protease PepD